MDSWRSSLAGGFAHITVAALALGKLERVSGFTRQQKLALTQFMPFVEVGAIAPDYPYLGRQGQWADRMHYVQTGEMIRHLVRSLRAQRDEPLWVQKVAWVLGYGSHVGTDLTIHPVVEMRVGPYVGNEREHRTCEMHQDAHIWRRRNLGDIGLADYFRINIEHCSGENGELNPALTAIWLAALEAQYPDLYVDEPPDPGQWNRGFRRIVDAVDDAGRMFSFTRHLLSGAGAVYPEFEDIDQSYVANLATPEGGQGYDVVVDRAVESVISIWTTIGEAISAASDADAEIALTRIPDGDLDMGTRLGTSEYIFWEGSRAVRNS